MEVKIQQEVLKTMDGNCISVRLEVYNGKELVDTDIVRFSETTPNEEITAYAETHLKRVISFLGIDTTPVEPPVNENVAELEGVVIKEEDIVSEEVKPQEIVPVKEEVVELTK